MSAVLIVNDVIMANVTIGGLFLTVVYACDTAWKETHNSC